MIFLPGKMEQKIFFRDKFSERDLNEQHGPLRGKLAREFANFCNDAMTVRTGSSLSPAAIRSLIVRYAPQFTGYNQQDSVSASLRSN